MYSAHVTNADWVFILTSTVLNNASASQPKFFFSSLSGISSPASTKQHDISANRHVCVRGPRRFRLVSLFYREVLHLPLAPAVACGSCHSRVAAFSN